MSALISDCTKYRYWLGRDFDQDLLGWEKVRNIVLFVMLNPSTADAETNDKTITRCIGFARSWGFTGFRVVNLYALRLTKKKELFNYEDPIGKENDYWLEKLLKKYPRVVCGWGTDAKQDRVDKFKEIALEVGAKLSCLGTNKGGSPKHPLYLKGDTELIRWED